ncbi:translational GTPase TypA [Vampirovibrio sp.]|uniref:translational GTPase TypA n=1 Tax=Vampirovibrio sp. TaxID=2717857 RepID=UPI0035939742
MTSEAATTAPQILNDRIRNIAIIAHVDHGKTTLVDSMFRQSGILRDNELLAERAMDSHDLEKERGITILAKNTAIPYGDYKVNILDTPGHADFSGEVERVLTMVDGALLIVDAVEGPMPQTRFVLRKALELGLTIVLVINKVDRAASDPERAIDKVVDLFIELGADEHQLDFPVVFASGLAGTSALTMDEPLEVGKHDLKPLMETIINRIQAPPGDQDASLQLQVSTLDYNDYLGRIVIGRITRGQIKTGQTVSLFQRDGKISQHRVSKLFGFQGLKRIEIEQSGAGDIVAVAGIPEVQIGETLTDPNNPEALPLISIEEPTLKMTFSINNSPLAGREGKFVTSRQLKDRLWKEVKSNISLRVEEGSTTDSFVVSGRGELHLSILIETMRREGYEFQVCKPEVLTKNVEGQTHEPFEDLIFDVPEEMTGSCIEKLCQRKGELRHMETSGGRTVVEFKIPSRGLLGFRSDFIRMTKGQGMMTHAFSEFRPWVGEIGSTRNGVLVASEPGETTAYALKNVEDRGIFFIKPRMTVYKGMIVGENNRPQDLVLNVCKTKKLTNMRSAGADVLEVLQTPVDVTLEFGLDYIENDELMEVTPQNIRLRKENLDFKRST